uniref:Protein TIC 214 n=1 Tax=Salsola sinkiangensis TaxID=3141507 RepID=A0AB38ZL91_9CARY
MLFQSFLLGNPVSLCNKIVNSVVTVGLYYGFLTTFSIGPSHFFLLRTQVMEEGEEGTAKKVAATTGFIMGQLIMFISIYYTPLYLALGRPHTITVLALPYLLFQFFWNNNKHFFAYESSSTNSMRNLSILCVFLNNLIFQLFNYFILPSAMLARLVNIYMFRCNNKMLFVTSSFVGWLIGHIFFMKGAGLVLVWIQQNHSIRSNKYLLSELRNSIARIFSILLFISCVYYLGRMPSPIFTMKLKPTEEMKESEEETDVEIEKTSETEETKQQEEGFIEEDPFPSLFSEEKEDPDKIDETEKIRGNGKDKTKDEFHLYLEEACYKNSSTSYSDSGNKGNDELQVQILEENKNKKFLWYEKRLLALFFDYNRWNRPTRYIKSNRFEKAVRNEMSQYFFYPCQNDGKQRISFTYLASLSNLWETIQRCFCPTGNNNNDDQQEDSWIYTNKQKKNNLRDEFVNRITILDKGLFYIDVLDKKTRLCKDKTKKEYLEETQDPLLNGSYRGLIKDKVSPFRNISETTIKNLVDEIFTNKIHSVLHNDSHYEEFKHKKDPFNKKSIIADSFTQRIPKKSIGIKEIRKKVPRWSYKLIDDIEQYKRQLENNEFLGEHQIRSRRAKRGVIYTDKQDNPDSTVPLDKQPGEIAFIRYPYQPDFHRDVIKGSMRVQRRKVGIWKFYQTSIHSPFFLDNKTESYLVYSFKLMQLKVLKWMGKEIESELEDFYYQKLEEIISQDEIEDEKLREQARVEIAEAWDSSILYQIIRGLMLITQSIFRKYILFPLFIITKNIIRILLFEPPEWAEDFNELNNERHVKCTYNGVELSETEFPKNWLTDGIQIKIFYPFRLKPWHKSRIRPSYQDLRKQKEQNEQENFCFLTVFGMETDLLFGPPREYPLFFQPIFKQFEQKIRKLRKYRFEVFKIIKEKIEFFLKFSNETKNWIIEIILFLFFKKRKKMPTLNPIPRIGLREESSKRKKEKDSIINNDMIHESSIQSQFLNWTNSSVTEKKIKYLANRTRTVKNKIEKIAKDNIKINGSPNNIHYGIKKFESPKNMGQILKRKNARLICKSNYILKFYREKIYIDIFLYIINYIINITRINTQLFLESTKNWINKSISNNETNHEKTNINRIQFILTIKKKILAFLHLNLNNSNIYKNSKIFSDFSSFSQAYVFYQLSQTQVFNFRSVLQYPGISLFLKNEIQNYFVSQGIAHSQLETQKIPNSGINQWKNWLKSKSNYHYDLPQINWSRLVPQKWRNKVTDHCFVENFDFQQNKKNLYQKEQLINSKNTNNSEKDVWLNPKLNFTFTKNYRYDVLSSKFVYYEDMNDSYKSSYEIPVEVNKNQEFSYIYNYNINNMWWNIPIRNYLGINNIMDIEKDTDRKYLDLKIIHFCLRKKINIEAWVDISTNMNENTKTESKNYQIINKIKKINKKDPFYHTIYQEINRSHQKKNLFDWMGLNEEILSRPMESWFFSEFSLFYNEYKMKPWFIPIDFLFLDSTINENLSANKNINRNKETNTLRPGPLKKDLEEEDSIVISKDPNVKDELEKIILNQRKPKSVKRVGLDFYLKKYLFFQLRWGETMGETIIDNIKVCCLQLRLRSLTESIILETLRKHELSPELLINDLKEKDFDIGDLIKTGGLYVEPIRLSVKDNELLILYQTIGISLVHKNKDQRNQKIYSENLDKKKLDLIVPENILSLRRRRELRILICLNSKNNNGVNTKQIENRVKNCSQFFDENKDLDQDKNTLRKLKFFLWPNYRLEDLACMNRYWFDTNNGSRFSILRIHMYPQLKIHF